MLTNRRDLEASCGRPPDVRAAVARVAATRISDDDLERAAHFEAQRRKVKAGQSALRRRHGVPCRTRPRDAQHGRRAHQWKRSTMLLIESRKRRFREEPSRAIVKGHEALVAALVRHVADGRRARDARLIDRSPSCSSARQLAVGRAGPYRPFETDSATKARDDETNFFPDVAFVVSCFVVS